ncbi:asparaginase [Aliifodinibius sp. S!AR15-10]|uniref:asparaginase n=1 Tax=Aliifodinibius sp. S!AR15-10 TaxID=2950437 RepID=UPI00285D5851|nr:asparaginase [Aliifodinibius sp. S!AR15-10]MDR8390412.1 asparaginase [Aliifodinibius sp. S!AR15-10]
MKRILLIQTGGTIAMDLGKGNQPELDPEKWSETIYREIPELSEIAELHIERLFFEDSSDINGQHWTQLIKFIREKSPRYDGFVILHGTDTMAYTASALSFGLQNLDKPVILTGSQVPMSSLRSDARRNLVNTIEMATFPLFEVAICFNDFVYRGNRSTKMSIGDFDAFASPNFPALAEIGLHIEFNKQVPRPTNQLKAFPRFSDRIFLLKLFPNLPPNFLEQLDLSELDAIIIEAFGSGNFPMHGEKSVLPFLERSIAQDLIVIITSQAPYDAVDLTKYESGRNAMDLGALSARDMTSEATLTKMMHLLANYEQPSRIKDIFQQNIAGEITAGN